MICHVYRRGKTYWAKLKLDHEQSLSRFSLGCSDRRVANDKLREIAILREKEHSGMVPPQTTREAALKPLPELLAAYLDELRVQGRAVGTLDKYRTNLSRTFRLCRWQFLRDITPASFCEWRVRSGLSPKSLNDMRAGLFTFIRWLVWQRLALENPLSHVRKIDTRGRCGQFRRTFTSSELAAFLQVAPPERRIVYLTAYFTGLRRTELKGLRWQDVVFESAVIRAPASITKNRQSAILPLHADLATALRAYRPHDTAPFTPVFASIPRMSTFRRDLRDAGIPFHDDQQRRLDLHSLRGTYGTNLTLSGAMPRVVMELMRHSDIKLTMKLYTDAGQLPLAEAVAKLPSVALKTVCPETCPDSARDRSQSVAS